MAAKVLFINPPTPQFRKFARNTDCAAESKGNYLMQPFDFLLLSGAFPSGVQIEMLDCVAEQLTRDEAFRKIASDLQLIVLAIADSVYLDDLEFLKSLRARFPQTSLLTFGDALLESENADEAEHWADGVILSPLLFAGHRIEVWSNREAIALSKSELGLRDSKLKSVLNKKPSLGSALRPRHELFLHSRYRWPFARFKTYTTVTTSWGCPYSCAYCTCAQLPSIYRGADNIILELRQIAELGIREIYFGDKSFGLPKQNTIEILSAMKELRFGFSWSTYFNPNQYEPELLDLMKSTGCHTIIIGIESANLKSLSLHKRFVAKEKIQLLLEHCDRIGIEVCGDFMFGLPGETAEQMEETIKYALALPLDYASFNIAAPLPGSSIKASAIENGNMKASDHHFDSLGRSRVLASDVVDANTLVKIRNQALFSFYLRPRYLLRRLLGIRSFEQLLIQLEEAVSLFWKAI